MTTCKNCNLDFDGLYCCHCGQKNYTEKDKMVGQLLKEGLRLITNFEGQLFVSLKTLLLHPGRLTKDYCLGRRKRYMKPVSLYLIMVIAYLLFPLFSGLNMEMRNYKTMPLVGGFISQQIEDKIREGNASEEQLAVRFHEQSQVVSKVSLFLFIPFSAVFIFLLYYGREKWWFDRFILAIEINIIYVFVLYILFPVFYFLAMYLVGFSYQNDEATGFLLTTIFGFYVAVVFHKLFKTKWWSSLAKGLLFSYIHTFIILLLYKIAVFQLTWLLV
jgi:hypothetical protein